MAKAIEQNPVRFAVTIALGRKKDKMNILSVEERAKILACLVEGCSMRSTQRLCGVAKKTVERLLVAAGTACAKYHNEHVRNLTCGSVQIDEIWSFIGAKQIHTPWLLRDTGERGDIWTFTGIDADTKLIVAWYTGSRKTGDALEFLMDLKSRLASRIQLTSDGLLSYTHTVPRAFGDDVDYAMLVKIFEHKPSGKYSPPECIGTEKIPKIGFPDKGLISTSYVERQNLTVRMGNRRLTRLTNGYSKKTENHRHSMALHFMHYNFCRLHSTIRVTPAMAAGLTDHVWEISDLVRLIDSK